MGVQYFQPRESRIPRWAICSPNTHQRGAGAWGGTDSLPQSPPTRGQVHLGEKTTAASRKTSTGRATVPSGGWGWGGVGACLPLTGRSPCPGSFLPLETRSFWSKGAQG